VFRLTQTGVLFCFHGGSMAERVVFKPACIIDEPVKSPEAVMSRLWRESGIHNLLNSVDSRFRGNDKKRRFLAFYQHIIISFLKS